MRIIKSDPRAREKPCLRCGLSLRKLLDATHCPQCGLSIWLSLNDNQTLEWSNPPWLARLSWAAWAMAPLQVLGLAAYLLLAIPIGEPRHRVLLAAFAGSAYFVLNHMVLLVLGANERRHPDRLRSYRIAIAVAAVVGILFGAALLARAVTYVPGGWPIAQYAMAATQPAEEIDDVAAPLPFSTPPWLLGAELVLILSAAATFAYLRKLAQRIPNGPISKLCGYILLAPLVSLAKSVPIWGYFLVVYLFWVTRYLPLAYFPLTAGLFVWFARAFRRASLSAAESWNAETRLPSAAPAAST